MKWELNCPVWDLDASEWIVLIEVISASWGLGAGVFVCGRPGCVKSPPWLTDLCGKRLLCLNKTAFFEAP